IGWVAQRARWSLLAIVIAAALAGGAYALWQQVGRRVEGGPEYRLRPTQIEITPTPPRIPARIRGEGGRRKAMNGTWWRLKKELTVDIMNAFRLHPWVAKVQRVSKSPSGVVQVDLFYRQPAAMVEVSGGVLPIDTEGVVLPSEDFTREQARDFPRIGGVQST